MKKAIPKALGRCAAGHVNVVVYSDAAECRWAKVKDAWVAPSKQKGKAPEGVSFCGRPLAEWALNGSKEV